MFKVNPMKRSGDIALYQELRLYVSPTETKIKLMPNGIATPEAVKLNGRGFFRQWGWRAGDVNYYPVPQMTAERIAMLPSWDDIQSAEPTSAPPECVCSARDLLWNGCTCAFSRAKRAGGYRDPCPIS